jgi:hypothetical protein
MISPSAAQSMSLKRMVLQSGDGFDAVLRLRGTTHALAQRKSLLRKCNPELARQHKSDSSEESETKFSRESERRIAMKRITSIVGFVLASLVTTGTGLAQTYSVKATVPFNFAVGRTWLPAGTYVISEMSPQLIALRTGDQRRQLAVSFVQPENTSTVTQGKLVFHKIGDRYFLSQIDCPAASMTASLPTSKLEKKAREHMEEASVSRPEQVLIALNQ